AINQALLASAISVKENHAKNIHYNVYPNPVTGDKIILNGDFSTDELNMDLINILGSKVKTLSFTKIGGDTYEITLDQQIKNGIYLLNVIQKGATYSSKLIINNR
ncbi:MAG TPA: T9SS type A sorting domain-containing protein, partial [Bacteroidia bacterium]|nr:T9SS type A sorting domain-containing protein [Bacteroidia bacterium]